MRKVNKALLPYQNLMISGAILLFCVVAVFVAVIPSVQKILEMIQTSKQLNEESDVMERKLDVLTSLSEESLRQQLSDVLAAVPQDRSFPTLFETVEGVAAETGVSIRSISIAGGTALSTSSASRISASDRKIGTRTVPFSIVVEGPLSALEQFIARSPNVRRLLRIKVFSITFPKNTTAMSISLEMDGFYEPLPATLGTTNAQLPLLTDEDLEIIARLAQFLLVTQAQAELPAPIIGKVKENPFSP